MLNTTLDAMPYSPAQLEAIFREILHTRMQGLPIINTQLDVQAIDFQAWEDYYLGMMITPWFMNLLLLPSTPTNPWATLPLGKPVSINLPAKPYRFVVNEIDGIGHCLMHSLHSPMFKFPTHEAAVTTAQQAMREILLVPEVAEELSFEALEIDRYLQKQGMFDGVKVTVTAEAIPVATETAPTALSRRELLFGRTRPA
ncbi:MAG: hypothetical protein RI964_512 [Pseudomonadota bacterium]|jgi:[NiFe] hydrogenase assembly HybE family chaperone